MSSTQISVSPKPIRESLPQVLEYGKTVGGLTLLLRSDPAGVLEVPGLPNLLVAIHVGRSSKIYCRRGGHSHCGTAVHGDIDIIPAHTSSRWEIMDANDTALILSLPSTLLSTVAEEYGFDSRRVEIRNRFQVRDPQIENICWALKREMESDYPSGRLYTDSLAMSVASRLVTCHSSIAQPARISNCGLNGRRLKQVLSYIDDNLAENMSLSRIASIAGVSASHLKALFRESAGMPVHQYLIRRRVESARTLLAEGKLSIAEIALATGFAHQSHLARHMHRILGISPRAMRQMFAGQRSADKK